MSEVKINETENNFTLATAISNAVEKAETGDNFMTEIVYNSFENTDKAQSAVYNAIMGGTCKPADIIGEEVEIIGITLSTGQCNKNFGDTSENPEKIIKPCVTFFLSDGRTVSTLSNGLVRAVKVMFACGKIPTEETPFKCVFEQRAGKNGVFHTLKAL